MTSIFHSKPWITEADHEAVRRALESRMIAQGELVRRFEIELGQWVNGEGGVAVASGSAAIALALTALGIGRGDDVVLPTYVCRSVLEAVLAVEGTPVLCDAGSDWVVTDAEVAAVMTPKTRAILVPHLYGIFADLRSFRRFGVPVIEDCAQAVDYRGRRSVAGDIAIFSFHPTKCLTVGEGGLAASRDGELIARMRQLRDGRPTVPAGRMFSPMSDLAASLGLSQLARYHEALDRRRLLASRYTAALEPVCPEALPGRVMGDSMFFRYPVRLSGGLDRYAASFLDHGIHVRRGVDQLLHRLYAQSDERFSQARDLFDTTVSLPLYPALTDAEHRRCVEASVAIFAAEGRRSV